VFGKARGGLEILSSAREGEDPFSRGGARGKLNHSGFHNG
jgi:hypothetical protein